MATSSSISGTPVGSSGTLATLINRCQVFLNDEGDATWDTEMIGTFLNDAIRDYSNHFPRIKTTTISTTTATTNYDLPSDFLGILSAEFPDGEDPPVYQNRQSVTTAGFWSSDKNYDIILAADDSNVNEYIFPALDATGETAVLVYHAVHQLMADPSTPTESNTVPEEHQPLLVKYVNWQASQHLAFAEQQSPTSNSSLLMAQLAQNARRNELSYHTALQQAIYAAEGQSFHRNWVEKGSGMERIY